LCEMNDENKWGKYSVFEKREYVKFQLTLRIIYGNSYTKIKSRYSIHLAGPTFSVFIFSILIY